MNRGPNPADEAEGILKVMSYYHWTAEEAARKLSISVIHVRQRLKLTQLIPEFFDMLKKGRLRVSTALRISSLPKKKQKELLKEEKLTLDRVEKDCRSFKLDSLLGDDSLFEVPPLNTIPWRKQRRRFFRLSRQASPTRPFSGKPSCSSTGIRHREVPNDTGVRQEKTGWCVYMFQIVSPRCAP
jgi:hypothetical protein